MTRFMCAAIALAASLSHGGHIEPSMLPASIRALRGLTRPGVWEAMMTFFDTSFKISVDPSCVATELEPSQWRNALPRFDDLSKPWWQPGKFVLTHAKWSAEAWLPLIIARSRWHAALEDESVNATVVVYQSRSKSRHALSWCRQMLARYSPRWQRRQGRDHWFPAISSRGACCDGGQARDPGLLAHHLFTHAGERRDGAWLFREARYADAMLRASQYKAPPTHDTSPRVRCFDESKDVSLPPPVWLPRSDGSCGARCAAFSEEPPSAPRDIVVFHAEGRRGGMEYDLRREVTMRWDHTWRSKNAQEEHRRRRIVAAPDPRVFVRFDVSFQNYSTVMRRSQFCIISEGYSPWSPRLTEAIGHGCVPAFLSPTLLPPYATSLDWSKFSVNLDRADIARLPDVLQAQDHAALFANLMKVRHLFAFCIDEGGQDGCGRLPIGDGLPLLVFEMATRRPAVHVQREDGAKYGGTTALLAAGQHDNNGRSPSDPASSSYTNITYACEMRTGTCEYQTQAERWRCAMVNNIACECQRFELGAWRYVGTTQNLVGHRTYLWQ